MSGALMEIYWNDINNNASIAYNEFGPFEPGLIPFGCSSVQKTKTH